MASRTKSQNQQRAGFRQTPGGELLAAIDRLASARCIEDVVDTVRATARKLLGSDGVTIILREDDFCHYVEEDAIGPLWKGGKFPMASCISGWAMMNAETAVISDIYLDDRIPQDFYRQTFVRSLAMAPVRVEDPIAAIGAYWAQVYEPSDAEIETLTTLAQAAGTAIENARLIDQLNRALTDAELARDELRHRVKNAFAVSQALARLTLPAEHAGTLSERISALARAHDLLDEKLARETSVSLSDLVAAELEPYTTVDAAPGRLTLPAEHANTLSTRIFALARAHELLDEKLERETSVSLAELIAAELAPYAGPGRLTIEGPAIVLEAGQAMALGLALNELATNTVKYGALSLPEGQLAVRWGMRGSYVSLDWTERNGPEVKAASENKGSELLKQIIERQLGGAARRKLDPAGVYCAIEFPRVAAG